jgi:hypothetical protein
MPHIKKPAVVCSRFSEVVVASIHRAFAGGRNRFVHFPFDPLYAEVKQRKDRDHMKDAVDDETDAVQGIISSLMIESFQSSGECEEQYRQRHTRKGGAQGEEEISECCFHRIEF